MDGLWEPMHWTQDINPVTMWIEEAYSGEELDIDYTCVSCPYYSYNYWGGLEYNNDDALLDGSVGSDDWFFAVGAISTFAYGENVCRHPRARTIHTEVDDSGLLRRRRRRVGRPWR